MSSRRPRDLVRAATARLAEAGVASPEHDAAELLAHVAGTTRLRLPLLDGVDAGEVEHAAVLVDELLEQAERAGAVGVDGRDHALFGGGQLGLGGRGEQQGGDSERAQFQDISPESHELRRRRPPSVPLYPREGGGPVSLRSRAPAFAGAHRLYSTYLLRSVLRAISWSCFST